MLQRTEVAAKHASLLGAEYGDAADITIKLGSTISSRSAQQLNTTTSISAQQNQSLQPSSKNLQPIFHPGLVSTAKHSRPSRPKRQQTQKTADPKCKPTDPRCKQTTTQQKNRPDNSKSISPSDGRPKPADIPPQKKQRTEQSTDRTEPNQTDRTQPGQNRTGASRA
ncbi:hypothetical protein LOK49_LG15G00819 [Camellia lanceoleosa]|uniref:Uncharacterized protein n=1 Tax=Camellia lanceoleosa TaxID=1840588 RepID=A0ACC0F2K9_9ERIC|nr:hypothetical protein LOK49_LG15G00819 [Camellia lanceoleosa]